MEWDRFGNRSGGNRVYKQGGVPIQKKLIVIPTTNLVLTLKSNTMKNSMQR